MLPRIQVDVQHDELTSISYGRPLLGLQRVDPVDMKHVLDTLANCWRNKFLLDDDTSIKVAI